MIPPVWCELTSADIPHVSIPQKQGEMTAFSIQLHVLALSFGVLEGHNKYTLHLEWIPINLAFFFFFNRFCDSLGGKNIYISRAECSSK